MLPGDWTPRRHGIGRAILRVKRLGS